MYEYQKRAYQRRRGNSAYVKPFLIILALIFIVFILWKIIGGLFGGGGQGSTSQIVTVNIETGSAEATTSGSDDWLTLPDGAKIQSDEKVKTGSNGRLTLTGFDGSIIRMDHESELEIIALKKKDESRFVEFFLSDGSAWFEPSERIDESTFTVATDFMEIETNRGVFAVDAPGKLYMIEGSADVDLIFGGDIVKSVQVSVGQQLLVDNSVLEDLDDGLNPDVIFAVSNTFEESDWNLWNLVKRGDLIDEDDSDQEEDPNSDEEDPDADEDENSEDQDQEEDPNSDEEDPDADEDENSNEDESTDNSSQISGNVSITSPSSSGTYTTQDPVFSITGSVPDGTARVDANTYTLQGFGGVGSTSFRYNLNPEFGNISPGSNTYTIRAYDEDGDLIDSDTINVTYESNDTEEDEDENNEDASTQSDAQVSGNVVISSPSSSSTYSTQNSTFSISGSVPQGTSKVIVNNYELQGFSGTNFTYNVSSDFGNIVVGANTYTVKAYNSNGDLISSDTITITLEESSGSTESPTIDDSSANEGDGTNVESETSDSTPVSGADPSGGTEPPTISAPSSSGTYQTDLEQIVISGSVGTGVEKVFLNGNFVAGFAAGIGQWSATVTLQPGDNIFSISGERNGENIGGSSITINYQP